jgi:hypothetical protein
VEPGPSARYRPGVINNNREDAMLPVNSTATIAPGAPLSAGAGGRIPEELLKPLREAVKDEDGPQLQAFCRDGKVPHEPADRARVASFCLDHGFAQVFTRVLPVTELSMARPQALETLVQCAKDPQCASHLLQVRELNLREQALEPGDKAETLASALGALKALESVVCESNVRDAMVPLATALRDSAVKSLALKGAATGELGHAVADLVRAAPSLTDLSLACDDDAVRPVLTLLEWNQCHLERLSLAPLDDSELALPIARMVRCNPTLGSLHITAVHNDLGHEVLHWLPAALAANHALVELLVHQDIGQPGAFADSWLACVDTFIQDLTRNQGLMHVDLRPILPDQAERIGTQMRRNREAALDTRARGYVAGAATRALAGVMPAGAEVPLHVANAIEKLVLEPPTTAPSALGEVDKASHDAGIAQRSLKRADEILALHGNQAGLSQLLARLSSAGITIRDPHLVDGLWPLRLTLGTEDRRLFDNVVQRRAPDPGNRN